MPRGVGFLLLISAGIRRDVAAVGYVGKSTKRVACAALHTRHQQSYCRDRFDSGHARAQYERALIAALRFAAGAPGVLRDFSTARPRARALHS